MSSIGFSFVSAAVPLQSAAKWPVWPHTKHLSCWPGMVITYKIKYDTVKAAISSVNYKIRKTNLHPEMKMTILYTFILETLTSLKIEKWISWVAKESIIRSASWAREKIQIKSSILKIIFSLEENWEVQKKTTHTSPYKQCLVFGSKPGRLRCNRM